MSEEKKYKQAIDYFKKSLELERQRSSIIDEINTSLKEQTTIIQGLDKLASGTSVALNALKLTTGVLGDLPTQVIELGEQLKRATGFNEKYASSIVSTRDALLELGAETSRYGVTSKENIETLKNLARENVKLLPIFEKNSVGLVRFSSRLKAFGVDTKDSAALIGTLTSNLDMTQGQLDKTRISLVSFANQTGQSIEKVVKDYSSSIGKFMDFLDPAQMNKSFMQFQIMARRMGMEAGSLYDMATKFDTIEGAQQLGSRLNQTFSALGIEFNALAIQEMEPRQRIDYIATKTREALAKARTMGGREGRLIMRSLQEAGGFSSLAEVRAFAAEGGMRRAGTFELGGGVVAPMTAGREAELARRQNFTRVAAAEAAEREEFLVRQTKLFKKLTKAGGVLDDFGKVILTMEERLKPVKDLTAEKAAEAIERKSAGALGVLERSLKGETMIGPRGAALIKQYYGIDMPDNTTITHALEQIRLAKGRGDQPGDQPPKPGDKPPQTPVPPTGGGGFNGAQFAVLKKLADALSKVANMNLTEAG